MKFNAKKGKLVTLFAKAYFGFSLTVLGCVLLVFWASDRYYDHMLLTPDMDAAAEDVHMISREYEKVNCFRYFGKNGGFAVFDPEGSLLYRDEKNFPYLLDIDEVLCVPDYDDFSFINSYELDVAQSGGEYLVVKTIYRENSDETETKQMLLDQDYHVISGPLQKNKMQYTAREYSILTGSFPEDAELLRHTMPDGRILVAAAKKWHVDDYTTVSRRANMIYWVLLPVSLLLITFFMLCTSLSKPQTMEISMPSNDKSITEEDQTKVKASRAITLILGGDDRVFYYTGEPNYEDYTSLKETTYEADGLRAMLMGRNADIVAKIKALKAEKLEKKFSDEEYNERAMKIKDVNTAPVVMIKATDDATYENLVDALDEMQICSISKYAIVDITEGDEFLLDNLEQKGKLTENIDRDQIKKTN